MFPLFAFFPYLVIPFIKFNPRSLSFGSYDDSEEQKTKESRQRDESLNIHERNQSKDWGDAVDSDQEDISVIGDRIIEKGKRMRVKKFLEYSWFCLVNYYTAPVIKFGLHLVIMPIISYFLKWI